MRPPFEGTLQGGAAPDGALPVILLYGAEVLREMLHRYLALRRWPEGKRVVLDFAALMAGLIEPVFAGAEVRASDLATGTQRNLEPGWPRDLLHAAVMLRAEGDAARIERRSGAGEAIHSSL